MDSSPEGNAEETQETYGFDLYPERRSTDSKNSFMDRVLFRTQQRSSHWNACQKNVRKAIKQNPLVKLLMGALEEAGCPVIADRHIVCEECSTVISGGYDQEFNQIVICQNKFSGRNHCDATLVHELIHMFDYCVGEIDFKNLEHLACTEIRAANLSHCSFLSSMLLSQSSIFNIKKTHQYCVKMKAAQSMILSRNINLETAMEAILKVFDKCYNDLEPIGRRVRRNSSDLSLAYSEGVHLGFCKP